MPAIVDTTPREENLRNVVVRFVNTVAKGGKVTVTGRVVVSADGKSRTVTTTGTTGTAEPAGRAWQRGDFLSEQKSTKFKNIAVYDKQ